MAKKSSGKSGGAAKSSPRGAMSAEQHRKIGAKLSAQARRIAREAQAELARADGAA